ncbi:pheromone-processing carboxypeptidase KEX1-like [Papaver somniferum]|nr:pheromone-processing carboxypeptidase KEX1-like [Papaver somniferum]
MAFRGRGFGRGFGRGGRGNFGTPEPFILFPEDVQLPDINDIKEERALVIANNKMQSYWKSSPYYLEMPTKRKSEENDIERYSDRNKANNRAKRLSFGHFLKLEDRYFPAELFQGKRKVEYNQSKGFSRQNKDQMKLDKFDLYENLERKAVDQESKGGNEKKKQNENENESDNEEPEDAEESGEESGDDYDKFENPDDDDDEYNPPEDDNPDDDNVYED